VLVPFSVKSSLVILGMHRSGTSLCAHWLSECGLNLGDRLMQGGVGNKNGHYEDLDFHDLHEDVFKEQGIPYGALVPVHEIELNSYFKKRFSNLIQFKNELNSHWGWKEPRTCLFLKHYASLLPSSIYLIMYRPCHEVVNSLWRRQKKIEGRRLQIENAESGADLKLINDYVECWIQYNQNILEHISQLNQDQYVIAGIDQLMVQDQSIIQWVNQSEFQLQSLPFASVYDPDLMTASEEASFSTTDSQRMRIRMIDKAMRQKEFIYENYQDLSGDLINSYGMHYANLVKIQSGEILALKSQLNEELGNCADAQSRLVEKEKIIEDAIQWQKKWLRRVFHKWRPPE